MNELYEILYLLFGVKKGDNEKDLKASYRRIANQFHPDKNEDIDPNIFIALSKGYELLLDDINEDKTDKSKKKKSPPVNLNKQDISVFATKKLVNTFRILLSNNSPKELLNLDIIKYIKKLFNDETENLKIENSKIRIDKDYLIKFKDRIESKNDSLSLIKIIEEVIEDKQRKIKEKKNKIEINKVAFNLLEEYEFKDIPIFEELLTSLNTI